jgi:hypothetical protein
MGVEEGQVRVGSGDEASFTHAQGVFGQRRGYTHQLSGRPGYGEPSGRGIVTDGNSQRRGINGCKFARAGQQLARGSAEPFQTEEDFVAMSVESGGGDGGLAGQYIEPGEGDYGNFNAVGSCFSETLDGGQAYADTGKAAWAVDHHDAAYFLEGDLGLL